MSPSHSCTFPSHVSLTQLYVSLTQLYVSLTRLAHTAVRLPHAAVRLPRTALYISQTSAHLFLRSQNAKGQQKFRDVVLGDEMKKRKKKDMEQLPNVSRVELEEAR
ncbi:crossover junction endonuclease EME1 [Tachysurus ichikawai]